MRHILTSFLALHWTVAFALLAFVCVDADRTGMAALTVMGISPSEPHVAAALADVVTVASLATAFMVVAVLFCWAFIEASFSRSEDQPPGNIIKIAFAAACAVLTFMLIGGAVLDIHGMFVVVAIHLCVLLMSYLAMLGERLPAPAEPKPAMADIDEVARTMARSAAYGSRLTRIVARDTDQRPGRDP